MCFSGYTSIWGPICIENFFLSFLQTMELHSKNQTFFERPEGELLSHVFYCDPMASWQKGRLEKNHEFIRYIIPKGMTFAGLNQEQVTLITNHINSVARASLNGCTPFELAQLLIDRKLLDLCQLERIPANQVILKPSLLKK